MPLRNDVDLSRLGAVVRARREALGLTANGAATRAGIGRDFWMKIEKGAPERLGLLTCVRIAAGLDWDISDLLIEAGISHVGGPIEELREVMQDMSSTERQLVLQFAESVRALRGN